MGVSASQLPPVPQTVEAHCAPELQTVPLGRSLGGRLWQLPFGPQRVEAHWFAFAQVEPSGRQRIGGGVVGGGIGTMSEAAHLKEAPELPAVAHVPLTQASELHCSDCAQLTPSGPGGTHW